MRKSTLRSYWPVLRLFILLAFGKTLCGAERLNVGFIYDEAPTDFSFNFDLEASRDDLDEYYGRQGIATRYKVAGDFVEREAAIKELHEWGAKLIFVYADEQNFSMDETASKYPDTKFVLTTGYSFGQNVNQILLRDWQPYYIGGYLLGLMSKTGKAGFITPLRSVEAYRIINSFFIGGKEANPNFQLDTYFVGRYDENSDRRARKAVEWLANSSHDVIVGYGTSEVLYQETSKRGIHTMSFPDSFARVLYGSHVMTGYTLNWTNALVNAVDRIKNGTWDTDYIYNYGQAEGGISFGGFSWDVPDDIVEKVNDKRTHFETSRKCVIWKPALLALNISSDLPFAEDGCLWLDGYYSINFSFSGINDLGNVTDDMVYDAVYVDENSGSGITLFVVVGFTDLLTLLSIVAVFIFRKRVIIAATNEFFCYSILFGALLGYTSLFFWIGRPSQPKCELRIWFLTFSASIMFGAIASKTYRIYRIWYNPDLKEAQRSWQVVGLFIGVMLAVETILLIVLTSINGYQVRNTFDDAELDYDQYYVTCEITKDGSILLGFIIAVQGVVVVICAVLAYMSKNVSQKYNETTSIVLSIYSVIISSAVVILLFVITSTHKPETTLIYITCGVYITITCPLVSIFLPKFKTIFSEYSGGSTPSSNVKTSTTGTTSDTHLLLYYKVFLLTI